MNRSDRKFLTAEFLPITPLVWNLDVLLESVQLLSSASYENGTTSTDLTDALLFHNDGDAFMLLKAMLPVLLLCFFDQLF